MYLNITLHKSTQICYDDSLRHVLSRVFALNTQKCTIHIVIFVLFVEYFTFFFLSTTIYYDVYEYLYSSLQFLFFIIISPCS